MIGLTACPKCEKQVAVPAGIHQSATVRCPMCEDEFTLADSLPADVPELIVVSSPVEETALAAGALVDTEAVAGDLGLDWAPADEGDAPESISFTDALDGEVDGEAAIAADASAADDDAATTAETAEGETDQAESAAATDATKEDVEREGDELGLMFKPADEEEAEATGDEFDFAAKEGEPADAEAGAADFSFGDAPAADFDAAATFESEGGAATATEEAPPKKKKGPGLVGNIVGIVVFGFIGLGLGYGILKFVKPEATRPIDRMLGLASDDDEPLVETAADQGPADDAGDFQIGGMLPAGQQPKPADVARAASDTPDRGGADLTGEDAFAPPVADDPRPFGFLLGGQADAEGLLKQVSIDGIIDSVGKAYDAAGSSSGKFNSRLFVGMCNVGDQLAFVEDRADSKVDAQLGEVQSLVQLVTDIPSNRKALRAISYRWLFDKRSPAVENVDGVFLVGRVQLVKPFGDVFVTEVELSRDGQAKRVLVLSAERPDVHVHDSIAVLGSLVRDPAARLTGYRPRDVVESSTFEDSLLVLGGLTKQVAKD